MCQFDTEGIAMASFSKELHSIFLSRSTCSQSPCFNSNSPYCKQLFIPPWEKPLPVLSVITPFDKRMSPSQQRDLLLQALASIPPADIQIFTDGLVRDGTVDGCAGLVVLGQDDLVYEWNAPTGTHTSSFQTEKATFNEAIQWLSSISS